MVFRVLSASWLKLQWLPTVNKETCICYKMSNPIFISICKVEEQEAQSNASYSIWS